MQRSASARQGDEGHLLCSVVSSLSISLMCCWFMPSARFIPGFGVLLASRGMRWGGCVQESKPSASAAIRHHRFSCPSLRVVSPALCAVQVAGRLFAQHGSYVTAKSFNFLVETINKIKPVFKKLQFPEQKSGIICALSKQSL